MATTKKTTADAEEKAQAAAETAREAEESQLDETVPGGLYKVGDRIVNSEGEEVKSSKKGGGE